LKIPAVSLVPWHTAAPFKVSARVLSTSDGIPVLREAKLVFRIFATRGQVRLRYRKAGFAFREDAVDQTFGRQAEDFRWVLSGNHGSRRLGRKMTEDIVNAL